MGPGRMESLLNVLLFAEHPEDGLPIVEDVLARGWTCGLSTADDGYLGGATHIKKVAEILGVSALDVALQYITKEGNHRKVTYSST
jgi:hypothetical protein